MEGKKKPSESRFFLATFGKITFLEKVQKNLSFFFTFLQQKEEGLFSISSSHFLAASLSGERVD